MVWTATSKETCERTRIVSTGAALYFRCDAHAMIAIAASAVTCVFSWYEVLALQLVSMKPIEDRAHVDPLTPMQNSRFIHTMSEVEAGSRFGRLESLSHSEEVTIGEDE